MTEEVKTEEVVQETPEVSEIEQKALDMGWRPRDEFDGTDDEFIDAKEFVRRKPLFDKIEQQGKQLKATIKALEGLKQHYTSMREVEYERALKALKAERKQALSDGDADRFDVLDDQIKEVESEAAKIQQTKNVPAVQEEVVNPEFQSWVTRNNWYKNVGYMREFADEVGVRLHQQGLSPTEVLKQVEQAVRKEFPHKFTNPNKNTAPAVESSGGTKSAGKQKDTVELSELERKVMNDLVRSGVLTKEEYISDIKKQRGIA